MKIKYVHAIGMVLLLNISLTSMVIQNYCDKKDKDIRTETGIFNEDYLYLGHELNFSGEAQDLIFLGKRLTFKGKLKLGLISLCKDLLFSGTSQNGVIAGALNVVIDGFINDNSYILCRNFSMSEQSVINGNLFAGCARLIMDGKLNGNLYAGAGEIIINNEIIGNVTIHGGRITFGDKGKINGNLTYTAREKLSDKDLSKIKGIVTIDEKNECAMNCKPLSKTEKHAIGFFIGFALFFSYIIVGSLLLFIPVFRKLNAKQPPKIFLNTALWGLIPLLMYPAIIVLCFAMIVTIPFAFILILAFLPLFFLSNIIGTTLLGKFLVSMLRWKIEKRHFQFIIGALAGAILSLIPIINFLSLIFICALGWGVYLSFIFNKNFAPSD